MPGVIDKAINLFRSGLEYGIEGFAIGIIYAAFVPIILQAYQLPTWLSPLVIILVSVGSIVSDWSTYGKRGFWFIAGVLMIVWLVADTTDVVICILALIVRIAKKLAKNR